MMKHTRRGFVTFICISIATAAGTASAAQNPFGLVNVQSSYQNITDIPCPKPVEGRCGEIPAPRPVEGGCGVKR